MPKPSKLSDRDVTWLIDWAEENSEAHRQSEEDEPTDREDLETLHAMGELTGFEESQKLETVIKRLAREAGYSSHRTADV